MTTSNLTLTLLVILNIALWVGIIFGPAYLLGDRLDTKHPLAINENARRMIFLGVPAIGSGLLMCKGEALAHLVGEKAFPYVFYGAMMVFLVAGMVLYNVTPKRWVVPLGIAGWFATFSYTFWHFWFGPGAFGHSTF